jgi:hypothetical protein
VDRSTNLIAKDREEYRQAAGAVAEAVISSVELIVQPGAKDAVGVVGLGPAKRIIIENSLPRPHHQDEQNAQCDVIGIPHGISAPRKPPVHNF